MSAVRIKAVGDAHAYTRSRLPWRMDSNTEVQGETATGRKFGWRLFRYIAAGGMKSLGRTVEQEELDARRGGFLAAAACLGAIWLAFWLA